MKKLRSILCLMLLLVASFVFVACGENVVNFNNNVFTTGNNDYDQYVVVSDQKVVFNHDAEEDTSGATYFGEADKNYDWDGKQSTLSFKLNVNSLQEEGNLTCWILSFNKLNGEDYQHVTEIRFGLAKTADGYVANELTGINWANRSEYSDITTNGQAVSVNNGVVEVAFKIAYENGTLTYTMSLNETNLQNTQQVAGIVGLRSLWNASTNVDGTELTELKFTK